MLCTVVAEFYSAIQRPHYSLTWHSLSFVFIMSLPRGAGIWRSLQVCNEVMVINLNWNHISAGYWSKSRDLPQHRGTQNTERKLSKLHAVCLCLIINTVTLRGFANYHSTEKNKHMRKRLETEAQGDWKELNPGSTQAVNVQNPKGRLWAAQKCVNSQFATMSRLYWCDLCRGNRHKK